MITLCTLFNTNYIDKGLTMHESIERYTQDYVLYVLCMDDRCFEILSDINHPRLIPIKLSDFESPELLKVKEERTMGEYCWTCSSCLVDYVMCTINPEYCAYIDSDLYFYDDVNVVVKEMQERNSSVMITGHRFNWYDKKRMEWQVGKYCVEFNTFKNDENGRGLLLLWKRQCLEYCKCDNDGIHYGDQKYLDRWAIDYPFCVETKNLGAGIAHWNLSQYKLINKDEYGPIIVKCNGSMYKSFFYHFQGLNYLSNTAASANTAGYWGVDDNMVDIIYIPYMKHIYRTKTILRNKYGVEVLLKFHPGYGVKEKVSFLKKCHNLMDLEYIRDIVFHAIPLRLHKSKQIIKI